MDPVMERRTFMAMLTGGIVVSPLAAEAQRAGKVYRVGFLGNSSAALEANLVGPFREELRELLRHVFVAEDRKLTKLLDETEVKLDEASTIERSVAEELNKREEDARSATQGARKTEDDLAAARASG